MEQTASFVAPVATTLAALIVASNLGARITSVGFIVFTLGSVSWTILGYPGIAIFFFLLAAVGGVVLAVWIIATDRKVARTSERRQSPPGMG